MASDVLGQLVANVSTALAKYKPPLKPKKVRTILVLYRSSNGMPIPFETSGDRWYFMSLMNCHYVLTSIKVDLLMLMDGITQADVMNEPAWIVLKPMLAPDATILEASK